jgi:anti-anti-sigma factor
MLEIRTHAPDPAVVVMRLDGELDSTSVPLFVLRARRLLGRAPHVVLDMQEVPFLSVRGLQALLDLHEQATTRGSQLHVTAEHHSVRRPLHVCGLDQVIPVRTASEMVLAGHAHH